MGQVTSSTATSTSHVRWHAHHEAHLLLPERRREIRFTLSTRMFQPTYSEAEYAGAVEAVGSSEGDAAFQAVVRYSYLIASLRACRGLCLVCCFLSLGIKCCVLSLGSRLLAWCIVLVSCCLASSVASCLLSLGFSRRSDPTPGRLAISMSRRLAPTHGPGLAVTLDWGCIRFQHLTLALAFLVV